MQPIKEGTKGHLMVIILLGKFRADPYSTFTKDELKKQVGTTYSMYLDRMLLCNAVHTCDEHNKYTFDRHFEARIKPIISFSID